MKAYISTINNHLHISEEVPMYGDDVKEVEIDRQIYDKSTDIIIAYSKLQTRLEMLIKRVKEKA